MSTAFVVANETNESIDNILWGMSCLSAFKIVALSYQMKTGKPVMNHKEKAMVTKQSELLEGLQNGE